jgi:hypothetical protein
MTNEALRLSLEALEETAIVMKQYIDNGYVAIRLGFVRNAINAIKEVQAQPEQEPVAGVVIRNGFPTLVKDRDIHSTDQRLFIEAPPQRQLLTDEIVRLAGVALREMPRASTDWHEAAKHVCEAVAAHGIGEKT